MCPGPPAALPSLQHHPGMARPQLASQSDINFISSLGCLRHQSAQPIASQHYGGLMGIRQYQPRLPANAGPDLRNILIQLIKFCLLAFCPTIYQQSWFINRSPSNFKRKLNMRNTTSCLMISNQYWKLFIELIK